jgi:hypothetical protein
VHLCKRSCRALHMQLNCRCDVMYTQKQRAQSTVHILVLHLAYQRAKQGPCGAEAVVKAFRHQHTMMIWVTASYIVSSCCSWSSWVQVYSTTCPATAASVQTVRL